MFGLYVPGFFHGHYCGLFAPRDPDIILTARFLGVSEIQRLIERHPEQINARGHEGMTPLLWAARANNTQTLRRLVMTSGVDLLAQDMQGRNILFWAVSHGDIELIMALQKRLGGDFAALINQKTRPEGYSALLLACKLNNLTLCRYLLSQPGMELAIRGNDGMGLLEWAAHHGNSPLYTELLGRGASVEGNPILAALRAGQFDFACREYRGQGGLIRTHRTTVLILATQGGKTALALKVLREAGNINETEEEGRTALYFAICSRNHEVFNALIQDPRIDPNAGSRNPMVMAYAKGQVHMLSAIVRHPAFKDRQLEQTRDWCRQAIYSDDTRMIKAWLGHRELGDIFAQELERLYGEDSEDLRDPQAMRQALLLLKHPTIPLLYKKAIGLRVNTVLNFVGREEKKLFMAAIAHPQFKEVAANKSAISAIICVAESARDQSYFHALLEIPFIEVGAYEEAFIEALFSGRYDVVQKILKKRPLTLAMIEAFLERRPRGLALDECLLDPELDLCSAEQKCSVLSALVRHNEQGYLSLLYKEGRISWKSKMPFQSKRTNQEGQVPLLAALLYIDRSSAFYREMIKNKEIPWFSCKGRKGFKTNYLCAFVAQLSDEVLSENRDFFLALIQDHPTEVDLQDDFIQLPSINFYAQSGRCTMMGYSGGRGRTLCTVSEYDRVGNNSLLLIAARRGEAGLVRTILSKGGEAIHRPNAAGDTPLLWAAARKDAAMALEIARHAPVGSVFQRNQHGKNALLLCIEAQNYDLFYELIKVEKQKRYEAECATLEAHQGALTEEDKATLLSARLHDELPFEAISLGSAPIIHWLMTSGIFDLSVTQQTAQGKCNLLMALVSAQNLTDDQKRSWISLLLNHALAQLGEVTPGGESPLSIAIRENNVLMVQCLLDYHPPITPRVLQAAMTSSPAILSKVLKKRAEYLLNAGLEGHFLQALVFDTTMLNAALATMLQTEGERGNAMSKRLIELGASVTQHFPSALEPSVMRSCVSHALRHHPGLVPLLVQSGAPITKEERQAYRDHRGLEPDDIHFPRLEQLAAQALTQKERALIARQHAHMERRAAAARQAAAQKQTLPALTEQEKRLCYAPAPLVSSLGR